MSDPKLRAFEKMALYLQDNIAPDDIYLFAAQITAIAALMQYGWSEKKDFLHECSAKTAVLNSVKQLEYLIASFEKNASVRVHFGCYEDNNTGSTDTPGPTSAE